jgi:hypothetical protein
VLKRQIGPDQPGATVRYGHLRMPALNRPCGGVVQRHYLCEADELARRMEGRGPPRIVPGVDQQDREARTDRE